MWFQRIRKKKAPAHPEAEKAIRDSEQSLRTVQARSKEVHEVAEASRRFRRNNHFADDLQNIFGGRTT